MAHGWSSDMPALVLLQQQFARLVASNQAGGSGKPIPNISGADIRASLEHAAAVANIPLELILACALAESNLNPQAERWGRQTTSARNALAAGDNARLQAIITSEWADISFGYAQRIVQYHYVGDGSSEVNNVLAVRQQVFDNPDNDLVEAAQKLAGNLASARAVDLSQCDGDELLGALVIYNAGHMHPPGDPWWIEWRGNVENYRANLAKARSMI
jgi:hypothetical protein